ncbi:hypothetical protein SAMN06265222_118115 [Neorhodopirellula lusitana]|uniref:Transmembrane protein n=1 Tax=Neorhodopirellula lusitana TaxID=445327 RepID=A0ABY1QM43_9BACT|nr:hypothetical protein SAMN06265222_118115 [Neorhodopirellula lusitana]
MRFSVSALILLTTYVAVIYATLRYPSALLSWCFDMILCSCCCVAALVAYHRSGRIAAASYGFTAFAIISLVLSFSSRQLADWLQDLLMSNSATDLERMYRRQLLTSHLSLLWGALGAAVSSSLCQNVEQDS